MMDAVMQWADLAREIGVAYQIEPAVILAIIWIESRGNPDAFNEASEATGLMQVIPYAKSPEWRQARPTIEALKDPRTNIEWGCKILRYFWDVEGNLWYALHRYSGGSCWDSYRDFIERYWQPFNEARKKIEKMLTERHDE